MERYTESQEREGGEMSFVVSTNHGALVKEFRDQQTAFFRNNSKPTSDRLTALTITASTSYDTSRELSTFRLGDWLMGLFCLLPIHLAVTASNVFIPMRDGFRTEGFEEEIAGATVEGVANR
jgi:hypothetical protein